MSKAAQIDIVFFAVLAISIIIIAPILMTVFREAVGGFSAGLGNVSASGASAAKSVDAVQEKFTTFFDVLVVCVLLVNIMMLFIMAFLVDVHPVFLLFYVLTCAFSMIFVPTILQTAGSIWGAEMIKDSAAYLPMTQFFLDNYNIIILVVMIVTGIITYAKIRNAQTGGGF